MSLFSNLPPPTSNVRKAETTQEDVQNTVGQDEEIERAEKRQKTEQQETAPPSVVLTGVQLRNALDKIASHIGNKDKFSKASSLFRQILDSGVITKSFREGAMRVMAAAFPDFETPTHAPIRRDYMKLCHTIRKHSDVFSKAECEQLDVYFIVGFTQNELFTDDSFTFNKVVNYLKDLISQMPPASDEEEDLYKLHVLRSDGTFIPRPSDIVASSPPQKGNSRNTGLESDEVEADPFGLDLLLDEKEDKSSSVVWSSAVCQLMRRESLLSCLRSAQASHKLAWAKTSVELLFEHCGARRLNFCPSQRQVVDQLMLFVKQQRVARRKGVDEKELRRDVTSFEKAQAEWSRAKMSHRGKVGAQHDAKANNWLG